MADARMPGRPTGGPPSPQVSAARAATARDEAITKLCELAGELVAPAAQLLARLATDDGPPDSAYLRRMSDAMRDAAREEMKAKLDDEIRWLMSEVTEPGERRGVKHLGSQIDALQSFRYRLYGQPLPPDA